MFKTKTRFESLTEERAELTKKANDLIELCQKSSDGKISAQERVQADAWLAKCRDIDDELRAMKAGDAMIEKMNAHGAPDAWDGDRDRLGSLGFDFEQVKSGLSSAIRQKSSYGYNMPFRKEAITAGQVGLPSSGTTVSDAPPQDTTVALRDLFRPEPNAPALVRYYRFGLGSGADIVPEGGLKPELNTDFEGVDEPVEKLAVRFTYSDEFAEDAAFLVSYVNRAAMQAILRRENKFIIDRIEAAPGKLISTGAKAQVIDVIAGAIGAAEGTNGLTPSRLVANPLDLAELRTLKTSGSGEYQFNPLAAAPAAVHNVPLTSTSAIPAGTMYLVTPGAGVFYTRGNLRVESGFATGDWEHNLVSTRVEERVLPAIIRPSLITKITLTA